MHPFWFFVFIFFQSAHSNKLSKPTLDVHRCVNEEMYVFKCSSTGACGDRSYLQLARVSPIVLYSPQTCSAGEGIIMAFWKIETTNQTDGNFVCQYKDMVSMARRVHFSDPGQYSVTDRCSSSDELIPTPDHTLGLGLGIGLPLSLLVLLSIAMIFAWKKRNLKRIYYGFRLLYRNLPVPNLETMIGYNTEGLIPEFILWACERIEMDPEFEHTYITNGVDGTERWILAKLLIIARRSCLDKAPIQDATSFIKYFLRSMKSTIFDMDQREHLHALIKQGSAIDNILMEISPTSRATLAYLMLHLRRLAMFEKYKMPIEDLSVVFASGVLALRKDEETSVSCVQARNDIMLGLISLSDQFWIQYL